MSKADTDRSRVLMVIPTLGDRLDLLRLTLQSIADQRPVAPDLVLVLPTKAIEARGLAAEFSARVVDDPGGLSAAINAGFATAEPHHEYCTWMGDDDLLRPGSLETSVAALDRQPSAVLAYGFCDYIDDKDRVIFTNRAGSLAPWIMTWGPNLVPLPGMMYRRKTLEKIGGFDESLKYSMDLDVLLKLRREGKFVNTASTLAAFRWHPDSTTVANRTKSLDEAEAVKRRYLPKPLRLISPLWEKPVRFATYIAASNVTSRARKH